MDTKFLAIVIGMAHFGGSLLMTGLCFLYGAIVGMGFLECEATNNKYFDSLHKSGMCESEILLRILKKS